jgi:predicted Zn-dependent protease
MLKTWRVIFFLFIFSVFSPRLVQAQKTTGGGRPWIGIIDVQVRNPDGTPGPRGIHIRLESAEGGAEADAETVEGGKCQFRPMSSGVFIVRLTNPQYKEMSERVELIGVSRSYITFELRPLSTEHPTDATTDSSPPGPSTVSVADLNIPENARKEFEKGQAALASKNTSQAAKHFEKAAKLFDNYPHAYLMLGETYLEEQDLKKSEAALKKSLALEPNLTAAYVDLGAIYNQQKDYPRAETALKKGLELSPDATAAKYELAKTYWATNRWQEAAPYAQAVVKDAPALAGAHVLCANILLRQRDGVGALREYKEYLRLEPGGPMATQVRAEVEKLEKALGK